MTSGISIHESCARTWHEMKMKHKYMFLTFKIIDDKEIVVDQSGTKDASYDDFKNSLPADDCRYAIVEIPGTTKLVFVMWTPGCAKVKARMIYASSRDGRYLGRRIFLYELYIQFSTFH